MHKTYLSLTVSRAWSAEMPIGDPCGGSAYGERNMPLVAVVAAASAVSTIATVGIAAMSAFQVIAAVGAITAGIGAITGNEKLTKIGGVVGLVGGVGAFAQGQGWLGGEAAKSATGTATSAATQNAQAAKVAEAAGGNVAKAAQGGADVAGQIESASSTLNPVTETIQGSGLINAPAAQTTGDISKLAGAAPPPSSTFDHIGGLKSHVNLPGEAVKSGSFLDGFKSVGKFMEDNKTLMTIGGNFIGGMFDKEKEAKEKMANAQAEMLMQQRANMSNTPNVTAGQRPPVFRTTPQTYAPVGLLNSTARR